MVSVAAAEVEAEKISTTENPLGGLGPRFNRRSPFLIGMGAAAGVALTYVMVLALSDARSALTLIGVALLTCPVSEMRTPAHDRYAQLHHRREDLRPPGDAGFLCRRGGAVVRWFTLGTRPGRSGR